jgi:electron transport complex protein RnfA
MQSALALSKAREETRWRASRGVEKLKERKVELRVYMSAFIVLAVFSVFSFNLVLKLGLGVREIFENRNEGAASCLPQWSVMFVTTFLLWLIFTFILSPLSLGFFEYFLLFPLTVFLALKLESLLSLLTSGRFEKNRAFFAYSSYGGLIVAALILTLRFADTVVDALILSFCLPFGAFLTKILLRMIRFRSKTENIFTVFKGQPFLLVSMALLSLVFSSIAYIILLRHANL